LIGVIYLKATFSTFNSLLRRIRDFAEVTLSNLLLTQSLYTKDHFSGLENEQAMINTMGLAKPNGNGYFALLKIKSLITIERDYGQYVATETTFHLGHLLNLSFPKPKSHCIAHFYGGVLAILFDAIDEQDAKEQLLWFKELIDKNPATIDGEVFNLTISVGVTALINDSPSCTIERARQALNQAEISGGHQVAVM
jgi:GGDEF domain-containing protein